MRDFSKSLGGVRHELSEERDYRDFNELKVLTRIEGVLVNETPIRIGIGKGQGLGSSVDLAVYRVDGRPIIPGSSLKGVLRQLAENLAASMGEEVHDPWDFRRAEDERSRGRFCVICGIFGSTELASHVRIYDAEPLNPEEAKVFVKTGVTIDREFGGARAGLLYSEELVVPKTRWNFMMDVINIRIYPEPDDSDHRAKLIRSLIDFMIDPGISVGARKSVGCGLLRLQDARWKIYEIVDGELKLIRTGEVKKS